MARWESWLRGRGGDHSLRQGMVWDPGCLEARIQQGVGRKNNKIPGEHKKSQPEIWRTECKTGLERGP